MPYVTSSGTVSGSKGWLQALPDFFWGALNIVTLFFQTLVSAEETNRVTGGHYDPRAQQRTSYSSYSRGNRSEDGRRLGTLDNCRSGSFNAPSMPAGG
mmetsp:Transcript_11541/g.29102  ORF Transcript_11541/g.29102 Transcript_11541/m.29102 type:complete len:98 (-) Transcript_11541:218-511(-)|eukprot:CAMPEP_0177667984 /NCGR_PEP_ID=MMETSP0447-20121125/22460_1 /TAXON_ID=0 /ORGANISM="Stygamoeba regulata, Strain BSH-02190019" /LENGTH=97 /DNA_ID=CAMNT_0019174343 /DNA_START=80 /DNA_END=373 /DNA_ORIENTATION=-